MKTLVFDQDEFDDPASEQRVEIAISHRKGFPHPTMAKFADAVVGAGWGAKLTAPKAFSAIPTFAGDAEYLTRFSEITVPKNCNWPCVIVSDEWNERHLLLDLGHAFVSYRWSTSA